MNVAHIINFRKEGPLLQKGAGFKVENHQKKKRGGRGRKEGGPRRKVP